VDTALNTALEAIDRLKTTASSHQRAFVVEVMGRAHGYLALMVGIAGGADVIVIPEVESDPDEVAATLRAAYTRGKRHAMVVVAEGAKWNATALADYVSNHRERIGFELRATILGHVQRGGGPGAFDRLLASRTAAAAVEHLIAGKAGVYTALVKGAISALPLERALIPKPPPDPELVKLAPRLAR
jgi:6-phosphofructokinase 1